MAVVTEVRLRVRFLNIALEWLSSTAPAWLDRLAVDPAPHTAAALSIAKLGKGEGAWLRAFWSSNLTRP